MKEPITVSIRPHKGAYRLLIRNAKRQENGQPPVVRLSGLYASVKDATEALSYWLKGYIII